MPGGGSGAASAALFVSGERPPDPSGGQGSSRSGSDRQSLSTETKTAQAGAWAVFYRANGTRGYSR